MKVRYRVGESRWYDTVWPQNDGGKIKRPSYAVFRKVWWWPFWTTAVDALDSFEQAENMARKLIEVDRGNERP